MKTAAWSFAQGWQSSLSIKQSLTYFTVWLKELQLERWDGEEKKPQLKWNKKARVLKKKVYFWSNLIVFTHDRISGIMV